MQSDEQEIRQLVATWMTASQAGDTDTVLSLMTDDVVFLVHGQPPMIGKDAFAALARPQKDSNAPQLEGKSEIKEVQIMGDWAFMWSKLTVIITPSPDAASLTRAGHTLSILKKQNGKWLLARDANMLAPVSETR